MSTASRVIAGLAALGAALVLSPAGAAGTPASPRYTYGELGYAHTDIGNGVDGGDGFALNGSYAFHPNFHLVAGFQALGVGDNTDATLFNLGLGFNTPIRPGMDGVVRMGWLHASVDPPNASSRSEDGFQLDLLGRIMINPEFELNMGLRYIDLDSSNAAFVLGMQYDITKNVAIGGNLGLSGDGASVFIGGRLYFNPPFTLQKAR
jgi:hypothetical protein